MEQDREATNVALKRWLSGKETINWTCPHCGKRNEFAGWLGRKSYTCKDGCGKSVFVDNPTDVM